jgi:flagellin
MTRINTNVSSLIAQTTLSRTNEQLQISLNRLSTGLKINTGKDDPAGLIASEALRSDITSINTAIDNTERANQVIATADSALGQVSNLLNDIRGLVTEAANSGALSDDEIAANQLQVDASLEAINRIAQTTTFQGRRVLDGSLDFVTNANSVDTLSDMQVKQANLGPTGAVTVDVDITSAATQASVTASQGAAFSANSAATATVTLTAEGTLTFAASTVEVRAAEAGTDFSGYVFSLVDDSTAVGAETAEIDTDAKTVKVHVNDTAATTAANVAAAIGALDQFSAAVGTAGAVDGSGADAAVTETTTADSITINASTLGPDFNNLAISITESAAVTTGNPGAQYSSANNTLSILVNNAGDTTVANIATAIAGLSEFSASSATGANSDGDYNFGTGDSDAIGNTELTGGAVLNDDLTFELGGLSGVEVFTFESGASINQLVDAVNLVKDATGVQAEQSAGVLTLESVNYGSKQFVNVDVISEGTSGTFGDNISAARTSGTDASVVINGVGATADGNAVSLNTATLDLAFNLQSESTTNFEFNITGGGALFQLGPDVVTNQQARLGLSSVNTSKLGGKSGRLFELGTGNARALDTDTTGASKIVDEVINKVTSLRGRLGAFQRTTLETNIASLSDTVTNLVAAESAIRDADFAKETAALTRAQILVQSGTSVLGIANQNPQNVLSLLR